MNIEKKTLRYVIQEKTALFVSKNAGPFYGWSTFNIEKQIWNYKVPQF
jgi:hypothetical protein